ncbi:hypothetical protein [Spirochaeta isovalerica]|uniref:Uncharacterized protein n=1 Tax=Spirochaeta isovalerica TaxID=150 RepID=A0A841RDK0_9SPIO|nr:hypothetical protein [Spirochaeta isovalerica]MBB6480929.1 hypothetical protein [Spirochaeta isovalerica]
MNQGDAFLNKVREITMAHLNKVAQETGALFSSSLPERVDGAALYTFLQDNYEMNEVQQIAACFVRLFNRDYDNGQFFFTELEFESMKRLLVFQRESLPAEDVKYIGDLVKILEKGSASK